jgi:presequence protease
VNRRLHANLHEAYWASEQMGGISYLFFLRNLAQQVETDWDPVKAAFERIRGILIDRAGMVCNITTDAANWYRFEPWLAAFLGKLPFSPAAPVPWQIGLGPRFEGLTIPTTVNFVGTWLWDKVRVQGGAYGGSCNFDQHSGGFSFSSYRDPNLRPTLDIYDKSPDFLRAEQLGVAELTRNIIGVIGGLDSYQLPDAKGWTSMANYLVGFTDELRQRRRQEVLSAGSQDFRNLADALAEVATHGNVVVMASEQAITAENAQRQDVFELTKVL